MRTRLSIFIFTLFSLISRADIQSIRSAQDAIRAYSELSIEAQNTADLIYPRGHFYSHGAIEIRDVRALNAVSDQSNFISRELHQSVLRLLKAGTPEFRVEKHLDRLKQFQVQLAQAVQALGTASTVQIQNLAFQADRQWRQLDRSLGEDFGHHHNHVSATCVGKSGGNFFTPKSHVECTIYGRGVRGYQAVFQNSNFGSMTAQGNLDPRLTTQSFKSQKVQVGWFPQYTIYAVTFSGQIQLVAQGTCQK